MKSAPPVTERIGTGVLFDFSIIDMGRAACVVFQAQEKLDSRKVEALYTEIERTFEHRMRDGSLVVAVLDVGSSLVGLSDEDLERIGLRRIPRGEACPGSSGC